MARPRLSEEIFLGEVLNELEDVGEVACLGPVEQGNDLAARQLTGCESRADEAGGGWVFGWGIQREIDQQVVAAMDNEPAERRLVSDPLDGPAPVVSRRFEGVPSGRNTSAADSGEEVEVLGGSGC